VQSVHDVVHRKGSKASLSASESKCAPVRELRRGDAKPLWVRLSIVASVRANVRHAVWILSPRPSLPGLDSIIVDHLDAPQTKVRKSYFRHIQFMLLTAWSEYASSCRQVYGKAHECNSDHHKQVHADRTTGCISCRHLKLPTFCGALMCHEQHME
jgi:hypothetical protein